MANVNFNLRKIDSKEPQIIYLIFRHKTWDGKKLVYPLELKIRPKSWDAEKQCVKNIISEQDKDYINKYLSDIRKDVISSYTKAVANRVPITRELIKESLDRFTNKTSALNGFFPFIEDFIKAADTKTNATTGRLVSPRTIQKYNTTLTVLKDFSKTYPRKIDFDTIDLDFYQDFLGYLTTTKNYKVNTVGKYIATLKGFLNEAEAKGLTTRTDHKSKRFKVLTEDSAAIYSSETELLKVYDHDFSEDKKLERVRDLFILGAFTGLRFSDFTAIKAENIKGDNIELFQQKTGGKVIIPIHKIVKEILDKYNGSTPPNISNQKLNDYIKDVYKAVEINEQIEVINTKGGLRVIKSFEKYKLVSSHTARRSFATNLYLKGIPSQTIMKITGHRTETAFLKYIRLDTTEHANILRDMWSAEPSLKVVK
jgi:integrase